MTGKKVKINRAPVLTLWAAVVAERLGYGADTALSLGRAVAGLNAQSKGRRLGIFEAGDEQPKQHDADRKPPKEADRVTILGRPVPTIDTDQGLRAVSKDEPISPAGVRRYLAQKFGSNLDDVRSAMQALAEAYSPEQLASKAYPLYEQFRPDIPEGQKGWGAAGELDLEGIRALAK